VVLADVLHRHLGQVRPDDGAVEVVAQDLEGLHRGDAAGPEGDEEVRLRQAAQGLVRRVDAVEGVAHVVAEVPAEVVRVAVPGAGGEVLAVRADGRADGGPVLREDGVDVHRVEELDQSVHGRNPAHGAAFGLGAVAVGVEFGDDLAERCVGLEPLRRLLCVHRFPRVSYAAVAGRRPVCFGPPAVRLLPAACSASVLDRRPPAVRLFPGVSRLSPGA